MDVIKSATVESSRELAKEGMDAVDCMRIPVTLSVLEKRSLE